MKKEYDAMLQWMTDSRCNLRCEYCSTNPSLKENPKLYDIDISALISTLNKTKKIFRINFAGDGEPFLIQNIINIFIALTEKHYISFNTNLTSNKIKEFSEKICPDKVISIVASLHIKELERLDLMDVYISNFLLLKEKGFKIRASVVAYPGLIDEADEYKKFFIEKGIKLRFDPFIGNFKGREYPAGYNEEELNMFGMNRSSMKRYYNKLKLCNAGYNFAVVESNGDVKICMQVHESLGNIYKEIKFKDNMIRCPNDFCVCPLNEYDWPLFEKAIREKVMK